jgi:hypothetical protein
MWSWPFNPENLTDTEYADAETTDRPLGNDNQIPSSRHHLFRSAFHEVVRANLFIRRYTIRI